MKMDTKKILPIAILLIIVYFLYRWWMNNGKSNGMISCDKCNNAGEPQSFMHQGNTCPENSIPSGTGNPCDNTTTGVSAGGTVSDVGVSSGVSAGVNGEGVTYNPSTFTLPAGAEGETKTYHSHDPANPNTPSLYPVVEEVMNPVLPMSETTLTIGKCNNPLNSNSPYMNILIGSPMTTQHILQFLNNMRTNFPSRNGQVRECRFLRKRRDHHQMELNIQPSGSGYISAPNHRAIKQAKVDFLTATINNCCNKKKPNDQECTLNKTKI